MKDYLPKIMKHCIATVALLACIAMPVRGEVDTKDERASEGIDRALIVGVWIAHPFDGAGTKPRIEFKKNGSARMLMQDESEMKAKWEWNGDSTISLTFPGRGKVIESEVIQLSEDKMTMVSARGRETKYVRLDSWRAKGPK